MVFRQCLDLCSERTDLETGLKKIKRLIIVRFSMNLYPAVAKI